MKQDMIVILDLGSHEKHCVGTSNPRVGCL